MKHGGVVAAGLLLSLGLVVLVAPSASRAPDGLQRVAADEGFASAEREHALRDAPLAGYSVDGMEDERSGTALSGAAGVLLTFVAGTLGLRAAVARRKRSR